MKFLSKLLAEETAATTVEYAIMISMILMAALVAIAALGQQTGVMYDDIRGEMENHGVM